MRSVLIINFINDFHILKTTEMFDHFAEAQVNLGRRCKSLARLFAGSDRNSYPSQRPKSTHFSKFNDSSNENASAKASTSAEFSQLDRGAGSSSDADLEPFVFVFSADSNLDLTLVEVARKNANSSILSQFYVLEFEEKAARSDRTDGTSQNPQIREKRGSEDSTKYIIRSSVQENVNTGSAKRTTAPINAVNDLPVSSTDNFQQTALADLRYDRMASLVFQYYQPVLLQSYVAKPLILNINEALLKVLNFSTFQKASFVSNFEKLFSTKKDSSQTLTLFVNRDLPSIFISHIDCSEEIKPSSGSSFLYAVSYPSQKLSSEDHIIMIHDNGTKDTIDGDKRNFQINDENKHSKSGALRSSMLKKDSLETEILSKILEETLPKLSSCSCDEYYLSDYESSTCSLPIFDRNNFWKSDFIFMNDEDQIHKTCSCPHVDIFNNDKGRVFAKERNNGAFFNHCQDQIIHTLSYDHLYNCTENVTREYGKITKSEGEISQSFSPTSKEGAGGAGMLKAGQKCFRWRTRMLKSELHKDMNTVFRSENNLELNRLVHSEDLQNGRNSLQNLNDQWKCCLITDENTKLASDIAFVDDPIDFNDDLEKRKSKLNHKQLFCFTLEDDGSWKNTTEEAVERIRSANIIDDEECGDWLLLGATGNSSPNFYKKIRNKTSVSSLSTILEEIPENVNTRTFSDTNEYRREIDPEIYDNKDRTDSEKRKLTPSMRKPETRTKICSRSTAGSDNAKKTDSRVCKNYGPRSIDDVVEKFVDNILEAAYKKENDSVPKTQFLHQNLQGDPTVNLNHIDNSTGNVFHKSSNYWKLYPENSGGMQPSASFLHSVCYNCIQNSTLQKEQMSDYEHKNMSENNEDLPNVDLIVEELVDFQGEKVMINTLSEAVTDECFQLPLFPETRSVPFDIYSNWDLESNGIDASDPISSIIEEFSDDESLHADNKLRFADYQITELMHEESLTYKPTASEPVIEEFFLNTENNNFDDKPLTFDSQLNGLEPIGKTIDPTTLHVTKNKCRDLQRTFSFEFNTYMNSCDSLGYVINMFENSDQGNMQHSQQIDRENFDNLKETVSNEMVNTKLAVKKNSKTMSENDLLATGCRSAKSVNSELDYRMLKEDSIANLFDYSIKFVPNVLKMDLTKDVDLIRPRNKHKKLKKDEIIVIQHQSVNHSLYPIREELVISKSKKQLLDCDMIKNYVDIGSDSDMHDSKTTMMETFHSPIESYDQNKMNAYDMTFSPETSTTHSKTSSLESFFPKALEFSYEKTGEEQIFSDRNIDGYTTEMFVYSAEEMLNESACSLRLLPQSTSYNGKLPVRNFVTDFLPYAFKERSDGILEKISNEIVTSEIFRVCELIAEEKQTVVCMQNGNIIKTSFSRLNASVTSLTRKVVRINSKLFGFIASFICKKLPFTKCGNAAMHDRMDMSSEEMSFLNECEKTSANCIPKAVDKSFPETSEKNHIYRSAIPMVKIINQSKSEVVTTCQNDQIDAGAQASLMCEIETSNKTHHSLNNIRDSFQSIENPGKDSKEDAEGSLERRVTSNSTLGKVYSIYQCSERLQTENLVFLDKLWGENNIMNYLTKSEPMLTCISGMHLKSSEGYQLDISDEKVMREIKAVMRHKDCSSVPPLKLSISDIKFESVKEMSEYQLENRKNETGNVIYDDGFSIPFSKTVIRKEEWEIFLKKIESFKTNENKIGFNKNNLQIQFQCGVDEPRRSVSVAEGQLTRKIEPFNAIVDSVKKGPRKMIMKKDTSNSRMDSKPMIQQHDFRSLNPDIAVQVRKSKSWEFCRPPVKFIRYPATFRQLLAFERQMLNRNVHTDEGLGLIDNIEFSFDSWRLDAVTHTIYVIFLIFMFAVVDAFVTIFYAFNIK